MSEVVQEIVQPKEEVAPIEVKKEPESKDSEFKANFEKIAKQEKHNSELRKQLEEKRKAFEIDKAELEKYRLFDKEFKEDPLGVLEKLGLPLSRINQMIQEKQNPGNPEARKALERIQKLEADLKAKEEKEYQDRLAKEEVKLNASIAETIKNEGYDIIEHLGMQSAVRDYMEQYYEETDEIIDIKDACEAIARDIAAKIEKVKDSKFLKPKVEEKIEPVKVDEVPKTLTNKMAQSADKVSRAMSEAERFKEAVRLLGMK